MSYRSRQKNTKPDIRTTSFIENRKKNDLSHFIAKRLYSDLEMAEVRICYMYMSVGTTRGNLTMSRLWFFIGLQVGVIQGTQVS